MSQKIVYFGTKSEELFEANIEIPEDSFHIKSENVANENSTSSHQAFNF